MEIKINIEDQYLSAISQNPETPLKAHIGGAACGIRLAIPDYAGSITEHYADVLGSGLTDVCRRTSVPFDFSSFGLIIEFDIPQEVGIYDKDHVLDESVKNLLRQFGPMILRNAFMAEKSRAEGQRNIFPDLKFHIDRGSTQDNQFSLFCRDPFDDVQKAPRTSSTLLIANIVGYLQAKKEGQEPEDRPQSLFTIFNNENLDPLMDKILLHQPWSEPEGTGEICVLDNRTVLHASYYREAQGYPIGVRYLF